MMKKMLMMMENSSPASYITLSTVMYMREKQNQRRVLLGGRGEMKENWGNSFNRKENMSGSRNSTGGP